MVCVIRVAGHRRFGLAKDVDEFVTVERETGYSADGATQIHGKIT